MGGEGREGERALGKLFQEDIIFLKENLCLVFLRQCLTLNQAGLELSM